LPILLPAEQGGAMDDDPEDEVLVRIGLDEETVAHDERRAEVAGRTLGKQLRYELEVAHGFILPDPPQWQNDPTRPALPESLTCEFYSVTSSKS